MTRQEEILKGLNESWGQSGINVSSNTANISNGVTVNNPIGSGRAVELNFVDGINATRLTSAQIAALPNPQAGQIVYQTDGVVGLYAYNGTSWAAVGGSTTVFGTTNRISVTGGDTIDIASTYVGQTSITTLGTVTTGTWSAVIGQATMTLGSDAAGDIYYRDGSGKLTRLGIGSAGQVLGVSAGIPAWQAAGGGITVGTTTITSGTSGRIAFNNAGVYGESSGLTWDNTNGTLTTTNTTTTSPAGYFKNTNALGVASTGANHQILIEDVGARQASFGVGVNGTFFRNISAPNLNLISGSTTLATLSGVSGKLTIDDGSGSILLWSTNQVQVATNLIAFKANNTDIGRFTSSGLYLGGTTSPTAKLHIAAGTAAASNAPLKLTAGTNLTTPENGAFEFDGTNLFFTPSSTRNILAQISGSTALSTGQIPFATTNGYLTSTSNLFWDNTNKRLGIGTSSPAVDIDVIGSSTAYLRLQNSGGNSAHLFNNNTSTFLRHIVGASIASEVSLNSNNVALMTNSQFYANDVLLNVRTYIGGTVSPTARLHLAAGIATAGFAPLKLTAGTNLTTPENGAFEFDGTNLYFTVGGVRKTVNLL